MQSFTRSSERAICTWTEPLLELGYHRIPTPPMHFFKPVFDDFAQYCAALRRHYRQQIKRSRRKLMRSRDWRSIGPDRSRRDPARVYPRSSCLVSSDGRQGRHQDGSSSDRVPASTDLAVEWPCRACSPSAKTAEWLRSVGVSTINRPTTRCMGVSIISSMSNSISISIWCTPCSIVPCRNGFRPSLFGMGADAFKARIGCYSEPLYVFVKGRGPLMSFIVRAAGHFLFAPEACHTCIQHFQERSRRGFELTVVTASPSSQPRRCRP